MESESRGQEIEDWKQLGMKKGRKRSEKISHQVDTSCDPFSSLYV